MRDWTKTLPNARFRGRAFYVDREELTGGGRKVAVHEFAKAEEHATEDMGRKVRQFRFQAYIVGDNADADARAFVEMCSTGGDGELILPVFGSYTAKCVGCSATAEKHRMGFVSMELEFVESGNDSAFSVNALGDRIVASLQSGMAAAIETTLANFAR